MKSFVVYQHPTQGYEAVKQGVSWPAFFFTAIWAFVKRMWGLGVVIIGVFFVLAAIEVIAEQEGSKQAAEVMLLVQFGVCVAIGAKANDWRRGHLEKRGYQRVGTVKSKNRDEAIAQAAMSLS